MKNKSVIEDSGFNYTIWHDSIDPNFIELCFKSRLPAKWISYDKVRNGKYKNSLIKPINAYVENLYPRPKLISIEGNTVTLRQGNHAEIYLQTRKEGLYNVDRPWMRQYYKTKPFDIIPDGCFSDSFKFYVPWFIDENIKVSIKQAENSPFFIYEKDFNSKKIVDYVPFVEPEFVSFHFKNSGSHIVYDGFGKIKKQSPMFDMVFEADGIMVNEIREFYEQS